MRSLHVLPHVCMGFRQISQHPLTAKNHAHRGIGYSKLTVGVSASVNGCLSLCVGPAIDWQPIQVVPHLSPKVIWDRLQHPP